MKSTRYYYGRLCPEAKRAYEIICDRLCRHEIPEIEVPDLPASEVGRLIYSLEFDNPELFYVNWCAPIYHASFEGGRVFRFQYLYTSDEADELNGRIDRLAGSLAGIAELSKTLAVHDWFIDNVTYDSEGLKALIQSPSMFSAVGPLLERKAVCAGISKLACCLLRRKGVEAIVVTGYCLDNGIPHAWNAVLLDGELRHTDITFDIGASRGGARSRRYFDLSHTEIVRDRSIRII